MKNIMMNLTGRLLALLAIGGLFIISACSDDEGVVPTQTIWEIVQEHEELTMIETQLTAAGLNSQLEGSGNLTLFAPSDAAMEQLLATLDADFDEISPEIVQSVLNYHIVNQQILANQLSTGAEFTTNQGEAIEVGAGSVLMTGSSSNASIEETIVATNGVVHIVDFVLVPPTIGETIGQLLGTVAQPVLLASAFTDFRDIIYTADSDVPAGESSIVGILSDRSVTSNTLFAQTNDVFAAVASAQGITKEQLLNGIKSSPAAARGFLLNHIKSDERIDGDELVNGKSFTMESGLQVSVVETGTSTQTPEGIVLVTENNSEQPAPVFQRDTYDGTNGILHVSSIIN